MKYAFIFIALLMLVICAAFAQPQNSDQESNTVDSKEGVPQNQTISVVNFGTDNVIGHLGHPLGTVVRVTGIAIDGDTTRLKRDMGKTLLEIHTVNGELLEEKILFDFHRAAKSVVKPNAGEEFDFYVHEYGCV